MIYFSLIIIPLVFILLFLPGVFIKDDKKTAIFAGGCFWCMEQAFSQVKGIVKVEPGYIGGQGVADYKNVSSGKSGYYEAIRIIYDTDKVSYRELLDVFWKQIDPTDSDGQFSDRGSQYKTAIFYTDNYQKRLALKTKKIISNRFDSPVVTEIIKAAVFYPAESYHRNYYKKNPIKYIKYKKMSGRDAFIKKNWGVDYEEIINGKAHQSEIIKSLSPVQYYVTQEEGTEPAFDNEFWDHHEDGIYVDVVSGEPLFSSKHKYDSGSGWPSFYKPLVSSNIVEKMDKKWFLSRTEIRSKDGDSHLGHIFDDGSNPTGLRYCINSASLRFIPKSKLKEEGYEGFIEMFD